jgi:hypothetical protein
MEKWHEASQFGHIHRRLGEACRPTADAKNNRRLEKVIEQARRSLPKDKSQFVRVVNAVITQEGYCFEFEDKNVACKIYVNEKTSEQGDLQYRLTSGASRGFIKSEYALVPYVRTCRGKAAKAATATSRE